MTHSTKARSIVEDSISIKGGIFYPTAMWGKKREKEKKNNTTQIGYKNAGRKRQACVEKGEKLAL